MHDLVFSMMLHTRASAENFPGGANENKDQKCLSLYLLYLYHV